MRRLDVLLRALSDESVIVDARDVCALGLYAALRNSLLQVIELVPAKVMTEVVVSEENSSESRDRITRRLLFAVMTPMLFVAIGSALIANAHVRRADEHSQEEIARVMARAVFDPKPATLEEVGLQDLYAKATELGFPTQVVESEHLYHSRPLEGGFIEITTPLDTGVVASAIVRFRGSTVQVLSTESLLLAGLALVLAAALGFALGNALTRDLFNATQGVRLLGTRVLPLLREPAPASTVTWMVDVVGPVGGAPDAWWRFEADTLAAGEGHASVEGRMWGADGRLVAVSRELVAEFSRA